MKRAIVAALPLFAFALTQPAFADDPGAAAAGAATQAQSDTSSSSATSGNLNAAPAASQGDAYKAGDADRNDKAKQQGKQNAGKKHPPTAAMDRAAPPDKAAKDATTTGKHPPAQAMERATPDVKSPGSTSSNTQDDGAQTSNAPASGSQTSSSPGSNSVAK